jgi:hypothetical protein
LPRFSCSVYTPRDQHIISRPDHPTTYRAPPRQAGTLPFFGGPLCSCSRFRASYTAGTAALTRPTSVEPGKQSYVVRTIVTGKVCLLTMKACPVRLLLLGSVPALARLRRRVRARVVWCIRPFTFRGSWRCLFLRRSECRRRACVGVLHLRRVHERGRREWRVNRRHGCARKQNKTSARRR